MLAYRFGHRRGPTEAGLRHNIQNWLKIAGAAPTLDEKSYALNKAYRIKRRIEELRETGELNRGHDSLRL